MTDFLGMLTVVVLSISLKLWKMWIAVEEDNEDYENWISTRSDRIYYDEYENWRTMSLNKLRNIELRKLKERK